MYNNAIRPASICKVKSLHLERLAQTQVGAAVTKPAPPPVRSQSYVVEGMTNDERGLVESTGGRDE